MIKKLRETKQYCVFQHPEKPGIWIKIVKKQMVSAEDLIGEGFLPTTTRQKPKNESEIILGKAAGISVAPIFEKNYPSFEEGKQLLERASVKFEVGYCTYLTAKLSCGKIMCVDDAHRLFVGMAKTMEFGLLTTELVESYNIDDKILLQIANRQSAEIAAEKEKEKEEESQKKKTFWQKIFS